MNNKLTLSVVFALILVLLNVNSVMAELNLQIDGELNSISSSLDAITTPNANSQFDGFDLASPTAPSNYSRLYSRLCSGSGNTCLVAIDAWDASDNPRVLNLTYFLSSPDSGTFELNWSYSNSDFDVILKDYGSDSTYSTQVGSNVNMSTNSNYTVDVSDMSFRYFTVSVTNQSAIVSSGSGSSTPSTPASSSSSSSSGGGGGGGGGAILFNSKFITAPDSLSFDSIFERASKKDFKIKNILDKPINLEIVVEGLGGSIDMNTQVALEANEEKNIDLKVAPLKSGLQTGKIVFYWGNNKQEVPVVLNVKSENFLFDVGVSIPSAQRTLNSGDNLKAQVNLQQVGPREKVDVTANYIIKDFSGNSYLEDSETFFVQDSKDFVKEFSTNNLPPGKYILGMDISYPGAFATSSVQFEVLAPGLIPALSGFSKNVQVLIIALVIMVVSVVSVVIWTIHRGKSIRGKLKK